MMIDAEVAACAERFWQLAGRSEPFPRKLESSVAWALPLVIVKLPRLAVASVNAYLAEQNLSLSLDSRERRLRACLIARAGQGLVLHAPAAPAPHEQRRLIARAGQGLVLLDGSDREDERRFSLAHEVAHFLLDHLGPRERALATLGPAVREVLDGVRPPSPTERLHAVLREVALTGLTHLLDRDRHGRVASIEIVDAEDRADRLALELLAPEAAVLESAWARGHDWGLPAARGEAEQLLVDLYGLPRWAASCYAGLLAVRHGPPPTFRQWLGPAGKS